MEYILGLSWDNVKENGNYYSIRGYILGLFWDNGKENGNYYIRMEFWPGWVFGFLLPLSM